MDNMKNRNMTERLVVQLDAKMKAALDQHSQESGVPISEFVRRAVVAALKAVKEK
jgi:ribbon-helix-helix CopG family protein